MSQRLLAFLLHGLISFVIAILAMLLVFGVWYPSPLHRALGVTVIFLLLLLVDVVLGPLMTLLVFKPGKKNLVLDLAVIAFLQFSALCYGLWIVASGRPLWVVFNVDRFDLIQAVDVDERRLSEALPEFRQGGWLGPEWVGAIRPVDRGVSQQILFESILGGGDIAQRPELYRPLTQLFSDVESKALPLDKLREYNEPKIIATTLARWPEATAWLPIKARAQSMVVLLNIEKKKILAIVPLSPW